MLTRKQQELLLFVHRRLEADGVSPSFDEMKDALSLKSKSGIHRLITGLEERGFIRRLPHRARALEVLKLPECLKADGSAAPAEDDNVVPFRPVRSDTALTGRKLERADLSNPELGVRLPLYGRIAAGMPIEALRDHSNYAEVPASLLGPGEHYALEVAGDSMVEAGILDGDTVIIKRCDAADPGVIVVALVDDNEVTLKRLRKKGAAIGLEAANPAYETRYLPTDRVRIQGRLIGLLRTYS
ncbi:MAG: transcriptional repressor LexA [Inquilinus limosus]|uniref:LexA repressor n=1 Tax=Inquilinus limosus TaxID=171674 RepID=A0A952KCI1_9PROT|nr:transcriptional repressor LexA [Inquilinus limosus]